MTEAEWLVCTDPAPMLEFLHGRASDRKLRLFAVACVRRVWHQLNDERSRAAIAVAEWFADGSADDSELALAAALAGEARAEHFHLKSFQEFALADAAALATGLGITAYDCVEVMGCIFDAVEERSEESEEIKPAETAAQADLLRDVFGNPFRPVIAAPSWFAWNGSCVVGLARAVYDERELPSGHLDAARLAVLADMLEEAGCADPHLLGHLRSPGPHIRGCWAVDAMAGRS